MIAARVSDSNVAAGPRAAFGVAALVFLLGLLARIVNSSEAVRDGVPQIGPFDELYHAQRILYSAEHPGRVLNFDPNRGLHGAFCPWPPLYDVSDGGAARLLGSSAPEEILWRAIWFPPLVGSAFAALIAWLVSRKVGAGAGLLSGTLLAIALPYLVASRLGAIDHHFLEPPLLFGILGTTALLHRARGPGGIVRYGAFFGIALTLALFVQTALLLAAAVSALAILSFKSEKRAPRWAGAVGFAIAALGVLLYRLAQPPGYPNDAWYLGVPHAAALLAAAIASAAGAFLLSRRVSPRSAGVLAVLLAGVCWAAVPGAVTAAVEGSRFFGGDPWLSTIVEFQPLFYQGRVKLWEGLCRLGGGALLILPLAAGNWGRSRTYRWTLLLFTTVYVLAAMSSLRFLVCAAPLAAVAGALAVSDLRRRSRALGTTGLLLLLVPALWILVPYLRRPDPVAGPEAISFYRAAARLAAENPAGDRILAPWSWGHVFHFLGGKKPVVDGFGASIGRTDFENALGIVLSSREDAVARYCRANGIRYLVLQNPTKFLTVQAEAIGLAPAFFVRPGHRGRPAAIMPLMRFSFWWRAYFDRGREVREPRRFASALRQFRPIYEDPEPSGGPARFRGPAVVIWELTQP
jgi:hypothetical protein